MMQLEIKFLSLICLILFSIHLNSEVNIFPDSIEEYKTNIEIKDIEIYILRDNPNEKVPSIMKEPESVQNLIMKIGKYIADHPEYDCDKIIFFKNQIFSKYIKKFSLYLITGYYSPKIVPTLVFAVNQRKIYRFGKVQFEGDKLGFNGSLKITDIKNFNKIVRKEKVKILDAVEALDLSLLFIKMSYSIDDDVILSIEQLKTKYIKTYSKKERAIEEFKKSEEFFYSPHLKNKNNKYFDLSFLTSGGRFLNKWDIRVYRNGKIEVLALKTIN